MQSKSPLEKLKILKEHLSVLRSPKEAIQEAANFVQEAIGCDSVFVYFQTDSTEEASKAICNSGKENYQNSFLNIREGKLHFKAKSFNGPIFISDTERTTSHSSLAETLLSTGINSFCAVPVSFDSAASGFLECHYSKTYHRFQSEDRLFLEYCADYLGLFLEKLNHRTITDASPFKKIENRHKEKPRTETVYEDRLTQADSDYKRLVEYSNLIIVRTDKEFTIVDVQGDTASILGLSPAEFLKEQNIWMKFMHPGDMLRLGRKIKNMTDRPAELVEEIRVTNSASGEEKWLSLKAIPLYTSDEEFVGWEGFGLDITSKYKDREQLLIQKKRIEALYEVSRSLQFHTDPARVALKGLRALLAATDSDAGLACFFEPSSNALELVAADGLSSEYLQEISDILGKESLINCVVETKQGIMLDNVQTDPRAATEAARKEGLKSVIVMPALFEGVVAGVIAIFCKSEGRYEDDDFELVSAASNQLALAARQVEMYAAEKRQSDSLGTLYRLSHELSKHVTPREIGEVSLKIIQKELSCKRMWLGFINEQETHIVGQAGLGPGVRGSLNDVQIELDLNHDFLDEAISTKEPVVVEEGQEMECSGLNRVIAKLQPGTFVVIPMIALGKVVGVLVVEPVSQSSFFAQRKLPLLRSMAGEIGSVILARRFEAKMADAEKMRMAGLLASGVAHNFNNLLQAIMGQASLLEIQLPKGSPLVTSAKTIIESSSKGASLIKHLLTFSMSGNPERRDVSINSVISDSADFYRSILGSGIELQVQLDEESPKIFADYGQLQQVITNLLVNSKDAIGDKQDGYVRIRTKKLRLRSGEIGPDLAPGLYLRIDVEDNGVGMDEERASRCFEPFYTTKRVDSRTGLGLDGTGLGLSSAYSILRQHDGLITVHSGEGEGAVFSIYVPALTVTQAALPEEKRGVTDQAKQDQEELDSGNDYNYMQERGSE